MAGSIAPVNHALLRPILMAGVEKRLALFNALLCFPLVAVTHLQIPASFVGVGLFFILHLLLRWVSRTEPQMGLLCKRASRFFFRTYYPALSHPRHKARAVKTVS